MKDIENELERLAGALPDGYEVQICVENGSAWLQVVTPSGDTVPIDGDSEMCWAMLMSDALAFCLAHSSENSMPEYLRAENLAPAVARGLTHVEHKAEWGVPTVGKS